METMPSINFNSWPFWAVAIFWSLLMVYKDILKPFFEKKFAAKIESEKRNTEIKRFNEESERWSKVLNYVEKNVIDMLSFTQSQTVLTVIIQSAAKDYIFRLFEIIDKNDIKNPVRQNVIRQSLQAFLKDQKNRLSRALYNLRYNNISLSEYIETVSEQHSQEFLEMTYEILFSDSDMIRKKDDLKLLIESHYNNHANEAIEFLNKKNT